MSIVRSLKASDFRKRKVIPAKYFGNSRYLKQGETYNVTATNDPYFVTVQLTHNPKLQISNGGVRFATHTFCIEEEERPMALSFKDLALEDQEALLAEAREIVEQENIAKNARMVFNQKKKELNERNIEEIRKTYGIKAKKHETAIHQRYINVVNMIYRMNLLGAAGLDATGLNNLSSQNEWDLYEKIANATAEFFINCYTLYHRK